MRGNPVDPKEVFVLCRSLADAASYLTRSNNELIARASAVSSSPGGPIIPAAFSAFGQPETPGKVRRPLRVAGFENERLLAWRRGVHDAPSIAGTRERGFPSGLLWSFEPVFPGHLKQC